MAMIMMASWLVDFRQILERFAVKRKPALMIIGVRSEVESLFV